MCSGTQDGERRASQCLLHECFEEVPPGDSGRFVAELLLFAEMSAASYRKSEIH